MRRVLGALGIAILTAGAAALTPLFAAIGAGLTFTTLALALSIWRWFRRRNARPVAPEAAQGA